MRFYAVTSPVFAINRSFLSRPLPTYLGSKFTELASADVEVTIFSDLKAAEEFAKTIKSDERAVGILTIGILDAALLNKLPAEGAKESAKIFLDPLKVLLLEGECPRLDSGCLYSVGVPTDELAAQLSSEKPLSQRVMDYFKYYYEKCGVVYKMVGLDHEQVARSIVDTMSKNPKFSDKEIVDYLQKILHQVVSESLSNVNKAFYKTLAYAIFKMNDADKLMLKNGSAEDTIEEKTAESAAHKSMKI